MQLVQGVITAAEYDSNGVLHIRFRRYLNKYELWATGDEANQLVKHYNDNSGLAVEYRFSATPIIIRFNEVTHEVLEVIEVE